jgi:hypothetical protein
MNLTAKIKTNKNYNETKYISMKKINLIFVLIILSLHTFSQKTGILPYDSNKVVYKDTFNILDNFSKTVKIGLSNYASHYNTTVELVQNKMNDYIIYEDSETIIANFKFLTDQLMNEALWDARATFIKQSDKIICKIDNIHLHNIIVYGVGKANSDAPIENADLKKNKKLISIVNNQIRMFYKLIKA